LDVKGTQLQVEYQPDDVIISPPAKCGTTVFLHLCQQLRAHGEEPTFNDQMDIIWWPSQAKLLQLHDPNAPQAWHPRLFKSHSAFHTLPRTLRKIYVLRDPKDALLSLAKFTPSLLGLPHQEHWNNTRTLLDMCYFYLLPALQDLVVWWQHRHDTNVFFACYTEVLHAKPELIDRLAHFLAVPVTELDVRRIADQTSHATMSSPQHRHRFDDHRVALALARLGGWHLDVNHLTGKVRRDGGRAGCGLIELPWVVDMVVRIMWYVCVQIPTGHRDAASMYAALRPEHTSTVGPRDHSAISQSTRAVVSEACEHRVCDLP
jgi:hypothetical protein